MKLERSNLLILVLALGWLSLAPLQVEAQADRRTEGTPVTMRVNSDPADVPCAGVTVFEENFDNGFPTGWVVVDGDGLTPRSETGLNAGWNIITDYKDTSNNIMASCSWYDNGGGVSNDWLISPQISLGDNPCFSWTAYSQDDGFPEAYEVYISTTGNDTSDFLAGTRIDTVPSELNGYTIRALGLTSFANQNIYIAFRQISDDKFVLALDNIKVSNIEPVDIGASSVVYGTPSPGDSVTFSIGVANYGADPVTSFELCYQIDGGSTFCMTVDTFTIEPNQIIAITHDSIFLSDTLDAFYDFCAWTESPNGGADNDASNDTVCVDVAVGSPVGIPGAIENSLSMTVFPNPTDGEITIDLGDLREETYLQVISVQGSIVTQKTLRAGQTISALDLHTFPKGIYFVRASTADGKVGSARIILH